MTLPFSKTIAVARSIADVELDRQLGKQMVESCQHDVKHSLAKDLFRRKNPSNINITFNNITKDNVGTTLRGCPGLTLNDRVRSFKKACFSIIGMKPYGVHLADKLHIVKM